LIVLKIQADALKFTFLKYTHTLYKIGSLLVCVCWLHVCAWTQSSNGITQKIATKGIIVLHPKSIAPGSVYMPKYDSSYYRINYALATLVWLKKANTDSTIINFRVLPISFVSPYFKYRYDSVKNNFLAPASRFFVKPDANAANINAWKNKSSLQYAGSFGRSISIGNRQDAVFNSQLNVQLSGYLADSVQVAAAITDNNIPIQPDGTTAQLNEFDRILLQFKKQHWQVDLGDIDIRASNNYFLRFYKRMQGVGYVQRQATAKQLVVSAGVGKGKFNRFILPVVEGNQGPYRLPSANGELYFVVLANTERVFIDGVQMQRGEDQDYTINYNTAEISFTPKCMITKDKRVQIEYEYIDRNYLNTILYVNKSWQVAPKWQAEVQFYQSADAKNAPINNNLDTDQKQFLAALGDSIQQAFYATSVKDSFSTGKILYAKRASPQDSRDSIYVYSTHPDSARYSLNFAFVGQGYGNYIPYYNNANGKVYQWIAPINGMPQGSYEPAQFLVTPKVLQLANMQVRYQLSAHTNMHVQGALSNYDVNTFSSKHKSNNVGGAAKWQLQHTGQAAVLGKLWKTDVVAEYEYVHQQFTPIERLRTVEFLRNWGMSLQSGKATEQLPKVQVVLKDSAGNTWQYATQAYLRNDGFTGYQQQLQCNQQIHDWNLQVNSSFNSNSNTAAMQKGYFLRPTVAIQKNFPRWKNYQWYVAYAVEHNAQKWMATDSVLPMSFGFQNFSTGFNSNPQQANKWAFQYFTRTNQMPLGKALVNADKSHNFQLQADFLANPNQQIKLNVAYRQLKVLNNAVADTKPYNTLLGRVEYVFSQYKGLITGTALYEVGAGQEQKRDFSYWEVQQGRGQYTWIDYNADGIQQLNEFELALYSDQAKYVRIYTASNQYVQAQYAQFNYQLMCHPKVLFRTPYTNIWQKIASRIQVQSALQTAQKAIAGNGLQWQPFSGYIADTALISLQQLWSNTLSFNRFSAVWGVDVSQVLSNNKSLLTYGFETKTLNEYSAKIRCNIFRKFTIEWWQKMQINSLFTPAYNNRNYQISSWQWEPRFTYTNATNYRLLVALQFATRNNAPAYGGEKASLKSVFAEAKANVAANTNISAKTTYSVIRYSGVGNTTTSYIMLDGLLVGQNLLWNTEITKQLKNNFQLSIQYEGRQAANSKVVHLGRASIRAML